MRDAEVYVETQVALQRGKGYVEQTATAEEPDVPLRTARLETPDGARGCAVEIVVQRDLEVTIRRGTRERDTDNLPAEAIATRFERRRDAIAFFDRYVDDRVYDGAELVQRHADLTQSHAALEAACRAAPDDPMPWATYADWLITQGDVLGEIASNGAAGYEVEAREMLRDSFSELFEDLANATPPELALRHGFVVDVTLAREQDDARPLATLTREVLHAPFARFVEALRFGLASFDGNNAWTETMRAICEAPCAPFVRALRFDHWTSEDQELSWVGFGDFSFAWATLPSLERLQIRAGKGGKLGDLDLPSASPAVSAPTSSPRSRTRGGPRSSISRCGSAATSTVPPGPSRR